MSSITARFVLSALLLSGASSGLLAQDAAHQVDDQDRQEIVDGIADALVDQYVYPDVAAEMTRALRDRLEEGEYQGITDGQRLADSLTAHLQQVSNDLHLRVRFSAEPMPTEVERDAPLPEVSERMAEVLRRRNYGFRKVERLPGNVGYIDFESFVRNGDGVASAAAAAMSFVQWTDALIIDLRRNGGGDPYTVALICSYLFGEEPIHLNSLYWRPRDETVEFWTRDSLQGPRYGVERPVVVLTSNRTFSGAEEFTYNLQTQERATIVGEVTRGGAHPGGEVPITEHFRVWVPRGRAINPITGTNWEGVGVQPDHEVPANEALEVAQQLILEGLLEDEEDAEVRSELEEAIRTVGRP